MAKAHLKVNKYDALCNAQGVHFLPIAVCAFGGMLRAAEDFISLLARCVADRTGLDPALAVGQFWQRLSVSLWRWNARMILKGRPVPSGGWAHFMLQA